MLEGSSFVARASPNKMATSKKRKWRKAGERLDGECSAYRGERLDGEILDGVHTAGFTGWCEWKTDRVHDLLLRSEEYSKAYITLFWQDAEAPIDPNDDLVSLRVKFYKTIATLDKYFDDGEECVREVAVYMAKPDVCPACWGSDMGCVQDGIAREPNAFWTQP